MSSSRGLMAMKRIGTRITTSSVGTTFQALNTMSPNGVTWPVTFSMMLRSDPLVACVSAIDEEKPVAQTIQPE